MQNTLKAAGRHKIAQRQTLAPQMRQGLEYLSLDLQQLRERLYGEMAQNPAMDDIEHALDSRTIGEEERRSESEENSELDDWPQDGYEDDSPELAYDADKLEKRRHFLDSYSKEETLEEHLRKQIGFLDLDEGDKSLAEILIGSLDADGRFAGSFADLVMVTRASEKRLRNILREIMKLDPPGCGATSVEECLIAQLDKIDDSPYKDDVALVIKNHLKDLASKDWPKITRETGIAEERIEDILKIIQSLEPHPGRAYSLASERESYIKPEIHAVKIDGKWIAKVDEGNLPRIQTSPRYLKMLEDPNLDPEARKYIREKVAAIELIRDTLDKRYDTIGSIAQAIFDAQQEFFEKGLSALKPMTMFAIAEKTGFHHSTVSRTVRGKYASTPFGTMELKSFFIAGIANSSGVEVAKNEVVARLKNLVANEDKRNPLSDELLARNLKGEGFDIARRTIAKYRIALDIPSARERKQI